MTQHRETEAEFRIRSRREALQHFRVKLGIVWPTKAQIREETQRSERLIVKLHEASSRELEAGNVERADKLARVATAIRERLIREGKAKSTEPA